MAQKFNWGNLLEPYFDLVIRSLIGFFVIIFALAILRSVFHLGVVWSIVLGFLMGMGVSIVVSRLRVGYKIKAKYDAFLEKVANSLSVKKEGKNEVSKQDINKVTS